MKVLKVQQIPKFIKSLAIATPLLLSTPTLKAQAYEQKQDYFEKSQATLITEVPDSMLESPELQVGEEYIYPAVVIDLSEGKLYHYDLDGYLYDAYPIASGKKSTPTKPGLRIVTGIEEYPYKSAPKTTKRNKNPKDYGPYVITLANIDMQTGQVTGSDGQFIHGTNNPKSIGKKASKGCVRLSNDDVTELVKHLFKEQYVLVRE